LGKEKRLLKEIMGTICGPLGGTRAMKKRKRGMRARLKNEREARGKRGGARVEEEESGARGTRRGWGNGEIGEGD